MEQIRAPIASPQLQNGSPNASKAKAATISRAIQALFSAYRRDDFADPDGFVVQLGTILAEFPEEVIEYITSPRTGLQRRSKWPPTISEVLTACEDHQLYLARLRETKRAAPLLRAPSKLGVPGSLANVFVPNDNPRYGRLVEWCKQANPIWYRYGKSSDGRDGIWVGRNHWDDGLPSQAQREAAE